MPHARSKHTRIPHLELRPQGYVWRRRLPRAVLESPCSERLCGEPVFRSIRIKPTPDDRILRNGSGRSDPAPNSQARNLGSQTAFAGIPICLSLKTHGFSVAAELARRLSILSDQVFLYATATMSLLPENTKEILTTLARFEIEAADRERALGDPRSPQLAHAALQREAARQAVLRQAFFQQDYAVAQEPLRHVAAHLGIELPDAGSEDARILAYEATRVMLDTSEEKARRDRGVFPSPSPYFARAIAEETSLGIPAQPTASAIAEPPIDKEEAMKLFPPSWFASREPAQEESGPEETPTAKPTVRELLKKRGLLQSCPPEILASLESGEPITFDRGVDLYLNWKEAGFADECVERQPS